MPRTSPLPAMSRNATIVISVVTFHVLALWALQTGLLRRVAEVIVPAEILVEIMAPAATAPKPQPAPQPKAEVKTPTPKTLQPTPAPTVAPTPTPLAIAPSAPAPAAMAAAPTAVLNAGSAVNAPPAPPAPPKVELPSSAADYLNNPKPPYPALSKRLGEQGKVLVHVLIGTDGTASQASIKQSSGFDRLDQASMATALKWRYVPGKRGGVAEAMWFDVPFVWELR